jgi:FkbM family methyltransferase
MGGGRIRKISVDSAPLSDIIEKHGTPRYCKIDIEGADLDALAMNCRGDGLISLRRWKYTREFFVDTR